MSEGRNGDLVHNSAGKKQVNLFRGIQAKIIYLPVSGTGGGNLQFLCD